MTLPEGLRRHAPTPLQLDALLFAGSCGFAALLWRFSSLSPHRDWSRDAIVGYAACAVAAAVLSKVRPRRELLARIALTAICGVVVALVPLGLMVVARADTTKEEHILPEAAVIERAGQLLANARDPYVAEVVHGHLIGRVPGVPRYEAFFPYFPLMAAFGLTSALHGGVLGDSRIPMVAVVLLCLLASLLIAKPPPERTLRAVQVMCVLPTGALFLAGGGDDLPVLAVSLLGIVAVVAARPRLAGAAFGVAMAMKLTVWPLAILSLFVLAQRQGARALKVASGIAFGIVAAVLVPFAVWRPGTFFANTIAFPLGLSGVNSPAASPLPGHVLVTIAPALSKVLLSGLVVIGSPVLAWWLWRHPPKNVPSALRLTAVLDIVVMCVAPATRVGYVVYPVNLLMWAWMLERRGPGDAVSMSPAPAAAGAGYESVASKSRN